MPAKRRQPKKRPNAITPEAVELFKRGRELDPCSEEGTKIAWQLHDALGLKPWDLPPLWVSLFDRPEDGGHYQPDMIELRRQLEETLHNTTRARDIGEPA
jgi:hypothetical protein